MSKKSNKNSSPKNTTPTIKDAPKKENATGTPGPFQPHNAKKEGLGPNTNR